MRTPVYPSSDQAFRERFPRPANYAISPAGVHRNFVLASVLEPSIIHPDKTTPQADLSLEQRLAFFHTAAVNSGEAFRTLAHRLHEAQEHSSQQPLLYDIHLAAQIASKDQREGGRINHGIIGMLIPIVASQILYLDGSPNPDNVQQAFDDIGTVLANTTEEDVEWLRQAEELSYELSHHQGRAGEPHRYAGETVLEYYTSRAQGPELDQHDSVYYDELLTNLGTAQRLVGAVGAVALQPKTPETGVQDVLSEACTTLMVESPKPYEGGVMADNAAVALYMLLSHYPAEQVVF